MALAASSAWIEGDGGRMRLVATEPAKDGSVEAALQIEPKQGWTTYWREPGEAGIPPQITTASGSGLSIDGIGYPTPKHLVNAEIDEIGYDGPVTFPFSLSPTAKGSFPSSINVNVFIGLCRNICIPFQGSFEVALISSRSEAIDKAIIQRAKASLPRPPTSDFEIISHRLSPDFRRLSLTFRLPHEDGGPAKVIIAGPSGYVYTRVLAAERSGSTFSTDLAIDKLPKGYSPIGKSWTVVAIDEDRAIEAPLAFP